jgi:hypothetical protein
MKCHLLPNLFLSKGKKSFSELAEKAESKAIGNCTEIGGGCNDFLAHRNTYSACLMQSAGPPNHDFGHD